MELNEDIRKEVFHTAPLLRGCSFDGEKGKIVAAGRFGGPDGPQTGSAARNADRQQEGDGGKGPGAKGRAPLFIEAGASDGEIIRLWRRYKENNGTGPELVAVKGGAVYALGNTFDQAHQMLEAYPGGEDPAAEPVIYDRNAVVQGKVAVVTGGAQGFGEGLVRKLAAAGALVFAADLNFEGAQELAGELNLKHEKTVAVPVEVNVADEESVARMVQTVVEGAGGIDIFISNAGVLKAGSVKEMALRDFRFVTEVNYIGYFLCTKYASRVMALQNKPSGRYYTDIIQINSKSGLEGSNKNGAYAGGKFGGIGLTQSFAKELVADNIKVNSICPGNFFDGPLWSDPENGLFVQYLRAGKVPGAKSVEEVRRFYEAKVPMNRGCLVEDVMKAVYYVIEQRYETGQAVPVTGGQNMLK